MPPRSEIEERLNRAIGIKKDIIELMSMPDDARLFLSNPDWIRIQDKLLEMRWEHLMLALEAHSFADKEYERGVCAGLQLAIEAPAEALKKERMR